MEIINTPIFIITLILFLILISNFKESFSDYRVNYPFDAYPQKNTKFLQKLPYQSLSTRHYKTMYQNKTTPKCVLRGTCDTTPGYYKHYQGYFDYPKKLQDFALGYSVNGFPYNDYHFKSTPSMNHTDLKHPVYQYDYPEWYDYQHPRKEAQYQGYPFYYHGKLMK